MPHPDDPSVQWSSDDSIEILSNISRRERNRLSSIHARKKAKIDRHQMELNIARYRMENRLLRSYQKKIGELPSHDFNENVIEELRGTLLKPSSKSKTSSIRKLIIQLITGSSNVGHGIQNAVDQHLDSLDLLLRLPADVRALLQSGSNSITTGPNLLVPQLAEEQTGNSIPLPEQAKQSLTDLSECSRLIAKAKNDFHVYGEALRELLNQVKSIVKEEQQSSFIMWVHHNSHAIYKNGSSALKNNLIISE